MEKNISILFKEIYNDFKIENLNMQILKYDHPDVRRYTYYISENLTIKINHPSMSIRINDTSITSLIRKREIKKLINFFNKKIDYHDKGDNLCKKYFFINKLSNLLYDLT